MTRAEMTELGWDSCDVVIVSGDAYVDHPSFGAAVIGRVLEAQGFRVGIIAQPDWSSAQAFMALGRPNVFFGVTAGNMDSLVNRYTADRRIRSNDAYTPNDEGGKRPDRAVLVYAQRCREAFKDVPVVIGGIEASLRRLAHYDYWSDKVRRSVLFDAKADALVYGNAERALVEIAHRLATGKGAGDLRLVRGVAVVTHAPPEGWAVLDETRLPDEAEERVRPPRDCQVVVDLPSFADVVADRALYAHAARIAHLESNPLNGRALMQRQGDKAIWIAPPPEPLTTAELDGVFDLPYARAPHPSYGGAKIPAWEMIRHSVAILRGCFGGCSFCSITAHEGRIVQSRSEDSILREIAAIRDRGDGFTGVISDLGGASANMYRLGCSSPKAEALCRRFSCLYPDVCKNLNTDHAPLIRLYEKARAVKGVKKVLIGSGVRFDLAVKSPAYVRALVANHVGGYLKIAPEHSEPGPLALMMKPGIGEFDRFRTMFSAAVKQAGKEYYLIPYVIAAHPGTTDTDMLNLALWLKKNGFRVDQVQTFLPAPMALSSAMYHSGYNPLAPVKRTGSAGVATAKGLRQRRLHKAFLRYHDAENWPMLREALIAMGRSDLIGAGKAHLVPAWQPRGTGLGGEGQRAGRKHGPQNPPALERGKPTQVPRRGKRGTV
ncbi:MAG: YgiQ family radical SAM protein [Rhodospirillaceae bacterium]|nr:YgiQ family radical SAM protein [Rhodospirillaceae bacterium]